MLSFCLSPIRLPNVLNTAIPFDDYYGDHLGPILAVKAMLHSVTIVIGLLLVALLIFSALVREYITHKSSLWAIKEKFVFAKHYHFVQLDILALMFN